MATPLPRLQGAVDERTTLREMLDYYRVVLIRKLEGLAREQATEHATPTGLTLLNLVRHMAEVEGQFFRRFAGEDVVSRYRTDEDPNADFHPGPDDTVEQAIADYRAEGAHSNEVLAAHGLDDDVRMGSSTLSLRWIMVHMIEETARHAGHADVLRELTDGAVGD